MALVRTRPTRAWGIDPEPFDSIDRLFERLTGPAYATAADAVNAYPFDLYETDDAIVLEMAVPGVDADDLDLSIEGRQLSIRARVPEVEGEGRRYWTQTIPRGDIGRTVKLPVGVDADTVAARVRDGVLTLTMPKVHEAKVKKIAIDRA
jgi:HSP20 family protein